MLYENRLLGGKVNLSYRHGASQRGDLKNVLGSRLHVGKSTDVDLVAGYRRRGAERYYGLGPDASDDDKSYFTSRIRWVGGSVHHQVRPEYAVQGRLYYSEMTNAGPRKPERYIPTDVVFAADLPPGWGDVSEGMSYEIELIRDGTRATGRAARGSVQRIMASHFRPGSPQEAPSTQYRILLERFLDGPEAAGRQLALKAYWSWLDGKPSAMHFQRLLTNAGIDDFRGFNSYRFRDRGIVGMTAEYRYPVWDYGQVAGALGLDGYVFWDVGQVFHQHQLIGAGSMTHSLGLGVRLVTSQNFVLRGELARSNEAFIASLSMSQPFQRDRGGMSDGKSPVPMR
jgi:hypothetical protein